MARKEAKPLSTMPTYPAWQTAKVGRPTKYHPDNVKAPRDLGAVGKCTLAHVAAHFGVAKDTILGWMRTYPDFSTAMKIGQAMTEAYWIDHYTKQAAEHGIKMAQGFAAFHMKQHGWTDAVDHKHSGNVQIVVRRGIKQIAAPREDEDEAIEAEFEAVSE